MSPPVLISLPDDTATQMLRTRENPSSSSIDNNNGNNALMMNSNNESDSTSSSPDRNNSNHGGLPSKLEAVIEEEPSSPRPSAVDSTSGGGCSGDLSSQDILLGGFLSDHTSTSNDQADGAGDRYGYSGYGSPTSHPDSAKNTTGGGQKEVRFRNHPCSPYQEENYVIYEDVVLSDEEEDEGVNNDGVDKYVVDDDEEETEEPFGDDSLAFDEEQEAADDADDEGGCEQGGGRRGRQDLANNNKGGGTGEQRGAAAAGAAPTVADDDGLMTPPPIERKVRSSDNDEGGGSPPTEIVTSNSMPSGGGAQEGEIAAIMSDDKPWRTSVGRRRRNRRRSSTGSNKSSGGTPAGNNAAQQDGQQQQPQLSPFAPAQHLIRHLRSWSIRDRGGNQPEDLSNSSVHADGQGAEQTTTATAEAADAVVASTSTTAGGVAAAEAAEQEYSSDESSLGEEEEVSEESLVESGDEVVWEEEKPVEWFKMPVLPTSFCAVSHGRQLTPPAGYLDATLLKEGSRMSLQESNRFVWEQGILLRAVLQLLAERDEVGIEGSVDSNDNLYKKGPLKKLSYYTAIAGRRTKNPAVAKWKVKYVELRRGNLSYYEDSGKKQQDSADGGRKTVHLRQVDSAVHEGRDDNQKNNRGYPFTFEVNVQGTPAMVWAASSEEERQAWIRAIRAAMIGSEATLRSTQYFTRHERAVELYRTLRERLRVADTREGYVEAIREANMIGPPPGGGAVPLRVPVQFVRQQIHKQQQQSATLGPFLPDRSRQQQATTALGNAAAAPAHKRLRSSIATFWNSIGQTSLSINGFVVDKNSPYASERIIGGLTRAILEYDKLFSCDEDEERDESTYITELQAVSYARNILMTVLRSKEQQDAYCTANHLLRNSDLVVITNRRPAAAKSCSGEAAAAGETDEEEAIHLEVDFAGQDVPDDSSQIAAADEEMVGWVWARRKNYATSLWKKRYLVLSGSVLNYYEAATPRPHGLQLQLVLNGASVDEMETSDGDREFVLRVVSQDQERLLSFKNELEMNDWKDAIQVAIDSVPIMGSANVEEGTTSEATDTTAASTVVPSTSDHFRRSGKVLFQKGMKVAGGGIRAIKGAKDGGMKVIRGATGGGIKAVRGAVGMLPVGMLPVGRLPNVGMLRNIRNTYSDEQREGSDGGQQRNPMKRRPSMQVLMSSTNAVMPGKRGPTVQCVVQASNTFWVKARNDLDGPEETWMSVRAKVFQAFLMSGGPSGRITRGSALVELEFIGMADENDSDGDGDSDGAAQDDDDDDEPPTLT